MKVGVPYETMEVFSAIVNFDFNDSIQNFGFNFKRYALIPCRIKFKEEQEKNKGNIFSYIS